MTDVADVLRSIRGPNPLNCLSELSRLSTRSHLYILQWKNAKIDIDTLKDVIAVVRRYEAGGLQLHGEGLRLLSMLIAHAPADLRLESDTLCTLAESLLRVELELKAYGLCVSTLKLLVDKLDLLPSIIFEIGSVIADTLPEVIKHENFIALMSFAIGYMKEQPSCWLPCGRFFCAILPRVEVEFNANFFIDQALPVLLKVLSTEHSAALESGEAPLPAEQNLEEAKLLALQWVSHLGRVHPSHPRLIKESALFRFVSSKLLAASAGVNDCAFTPQCAANSFYLLEAIATDMNVAEELKSQFTLTVISTWLSSALAPALAPASVPVSVLISAPADGQQAAVCEAVWRLMLALWGAELKKFEDLWAQDSSLLSNTELLRCISIGFEAIASFAQLAHSVQRTQNEKDYCAELPNGATAISGASVATASSSSSGTIAGCRTLAALRFYIHSMVYLISRCFDIGIVQSLIEQIVPMNPGAAAGATITAPISNASKSTLSASETTDRSQVPHQQAPSSGKDPPTSAKHTAAASASAVVALVVTIGRAANRAACTLLEDVCALRGDDSTVENVPVVDSLVLLLGARLACWNPLKTDALDAAFMDLSPLIVDHFSYIAEKAVVWVDSDKDPSYHHHTFTAHAYSLQDYQTSVGAGAGKVSDGRVQGMSMPTIVDEGDIADDVAGEGNNTVSLDDAELDAYATIEAVRSRILFLCKQLVPKDEFDISSWELVSVADISRKLLLVFAAVKCGLVEEIGTIIDLAQLYDLIWNLLTDERLGLEDIPGMQRKCIQLLGALAEEYIAANQSSDGTVPTQPPTVKGRGGGVGGVDSTTPPISSKGITHTLSTITNVSSGSKRPPTMETMSTGAVALSSNSYDRKALALKFSPENALEWTDYLVTLLSSRQVWSSSSSESTCNSAKNSSVSDSDNTGQNSEAGSSTNTNGGMQGAQRVARSGEGDNQENPAANSISESTDARRSKGSLPGAGIACRGSSPLDDPNRHLLYRGSGILGSADAATYLVTQAQSNMHSLRLMYSALSTLLTLCESHRSVRRRTLSSLHLIIDQFSQADPIYCLRPMMLLMAQVAEFLPRIELEGEKAIVFLIMRALKCRGDEEVRGEACAMIYALGRESPGLVHRGFCRKEVEDQIIDILMSQQQQHEQREQRQLQRQHQGTKKTASWNEDFSRLHVAALKACSVLVRDVNILPQWLPTYDSYHWQFYNGSLALRPLLNVGFVDTVLEVLRCSAPMFRVHTFALIISVAASLMYNCCDGALSQTSAKVSAAVNADITAQLKDTLVRSMLPLLQIALDFLTSFKKQVRMATFSTDIRGVGSGGGGVFSGEFDDVSGSGGAFGGAGGRGGVSDKSNGKSGKSSFKKMSSKALKVTTTPLNRLRMKSFRRSSAPPSTTSQPEHGALASSSGSGSKPNPSEHMRESEPEMPTSLSTFASANIPDKKAKARQLPAGGAFEENLTISNNPLYCSGDGANGLAGSASDADSTLPPGVRTTVGAASSNSSSWPLHISTVNHSPQAIEFLTEKVMDCLHAFFCMDEMFPLSNYLQNIHLFDSTPVIACVAYFMSDFKKNQHIQRLGIGFIKCFADNQIGMSSIAMHAPSALINATRSLGDSPDIQHTFCKIIRSVAQSDDMARENFIRFNVQSLLEEMIMRRNKEQGRLACMVVSELAVNDTDIVNMCQNTALVDAIFKLMDAFPEDLSIQVEGLRALQAIYEVPELFISSRGVSQVAVLKRARKLIVATLKQESVGSASAAATTGGVGVVVGGAGLGDYERADLDAIVNHPMFEKLACTIS